nr:hypothetical protein [Tanacetum cinerariifolium]
MFQVENKNSKKNNDMYYPRFTKVIVNYFMAKDKAIPRRNKMFWHFHLTNQALLESKAYKTYHAYASGEKIPKPNSNASGLGTVEGTGASSGVPDVPTYDSDDEEISWKLSDDEDDDVVLTLVTQVTKDIHVILTTVTPEAQQRSSSVSSGFISNMLNPNPDTCIDSILNLNTESTTLVDVHVTTNVKIPPSSVTTLPLPPIPLIQP